MSLNEMLVQMEKDDMAIVSHYENTIDVTGRDFLGFDDNWNEVMNSDFDNYELWNTFVDFLKKNAVLISDDFYIEYKYNGLRIVIGYTSFDI